MAESVHVVLLAGHADILGILFACISCDLAFYAASRPAFNAGRPAFFWAFIWAYLFSGSLLHWFIHHLTVLGEKEQVPVPPQPVTHIASVLSHVLVYGFHFPSISFLLSSLCNVLLSLAVFLFSLFLVFSSLLQQFPTLPWLHPLLTLPSYFSFQFERGRFFLLFSDNDDGYSLALASF